MPLRHPARDRDRDRGSSLLEVVIACVLLGILSTAVLAIMLQTQSAGVGNRNRVAASNLAAREVDLVRAEFRRTEDAPVTLASAGSWTNKHPLPDQVAGQPLVVDGTSYTVSASVQWNVTGTGQSACDGGTLVKYPTLGVTVTVTWPGMGAIQPVVTTAALAPEKGDGIATTDHSYVAVRVKDSAGQPNPGRGIAVSSASQTVNGTTDAQGCAVVQVDPAAGGTAYTARVTDSGYVDIGSTTNPSKAVGTLMPGRLNNSVVFQVDRPGTVNIRLTDDAGNVLDAATATGAALTLVGSESAGNGGKRAVTATGPVTTVSGLWPTTYGAYVGSTVPADGYGTQVLAPGGTITLDAVLKAAHLRLTGVPDGTTEVVAVPSTGTGCTDPAARAVDPGAIALMPGAWSFYASGATFACAPGPGSLPLEAGDNGEVPWEPTTLRVASAPPGTVWAVNHARLNQSPAGCPGPAAGPIAVNVDAARTTPVTLPAGDWYIYVTDGPSTSGTCSIPAGQYSKILTYGGENLLAWSAVSPVTATGLPSGSRYSVLAWTGATTMTCTYSAPAGTTSFSKASSSATQATATLSVGTWNVFIRDSTAKTCTHAGTVVVDGSGTAYTLPLSTSNPRKVP